MAGARTIREAIAECFRAHPGRKLRAREVQKWVTKKYPGRWQDVTTDLAGLVLGANESGGYRKDKQFLKRVEWGVYRVAKPPLLGASVKEILNKDIKEVIPSLVGCARSADCRAAGDGELPPRKFWVPGVPSVWGTKTEAPWREVLGDAIREADPEDRVYRGVQLRFCLEADTRAGHPFDLDNLCEPVFRVLVNQRGHFGGRRPNVQWWSAVKRVESPPGCHLQLGYRPQVGTDVGRVIFQGVYRGELPPSGGDTRIAQWLEQNKPGAGKAGAAPFAVSLLFGSARVNIANVSTGPTKAIIDNLYPIISGQTSAPDDWRIQRLFVAKDHGGLADDQVSFTIMTLDARES